MIRLRFIWFGLALLAGACTFTKQVKTGMQAYEVKQYARAAAMFEDEYAAARSSEVKAQLAYFAGESHTRLNDHAAAANWYEKAYADGYGDKAYESLAGSLKRQEDYDGALAIYQQLQQKYPNQASYRSAATATRQAREWASAPNEQVRLEPVPWNTSAAEYMAIPVDGNRILFTSDRAGQDEGETYWWTGRAFADLFEYNSANGKVTPYAGAVNTDKNEGTGVVSADGQWLVFTRCDSDDTYDAWCKLMVSQRLGVQWSEPAPLPFQREKVNYGHPAFAATGSTLFFSSDAPDGLGGHDLYFTQLDGRGGWSEPVNLGPRVNTAYQEQFPTVYLDTLFFSSDQPNGLGGLDIFKTWLVDDRGTWASPINLGAPVNSGGDDFSFVVDTFATLAQGTLLQGYLTSSRGGAARGDDIYAFRYLGEQPVTSPTDTMPVSAVEPEDSIVQQLFLAIRVTEPEYSVTGDPNSGVVGQRELPNGPVILTKGLTDERFVTDKQGQLLLKLEWDTKYIFTARYRDHLASTYELNPADVDRSSGKPVITVNHTFVLDPIFRDKEIVLENIFYDYDQWEIREDAKPSLDKLSVILKNNPSIRILLSSYTDCRGTDEYNLELSRKRAEAAVAYLASVGIPARRLESRGLGESSPVIDCPCESCTEDEHQANRRTTFKIID